VAFIEGKNAVLEALRAGIPLQSVLLAKGMQADSALDEIDRLARQARINVRHVQRRELDQRSERGAHQGVIAEARPFDFTPLAEMLARCEGKANALVIVLDHVTDPGNFGAVARSAEACGALGIVVASKRAASVTPATHKAAAGALAWLPLARETNIPRSMEALKAAGFWVAGADEHAEQDLWHAPLEGRLALVLSAEGTGLSRLVRERCDFLVSIPMAGNVGSLNVAQAATLLSFEWLRRGAR
jgi:23S rRNA (guanosine2251-2'-O)-methyltransferase